MWSTKRHIAIFDLDEADCTTTTSALRTSFEENGIGHFEIIPFTCMPAFTRNFCANHYDMAFLGVDNMLGVEAARILRAHDPHCPLFLLSDTAEYALEGYRLHALDYILKPASAQRLREAIACIDMPCLEGIKGAHYG